MTRQKSWTILAFVLAAMFGLAAQSQKRDVVLDLSLPNGGTPQLRVAEGETGTIELPDVGKFGFVPTVQESDARAVIVELFDLNRTPHRRIARLELIAGGDRVQSGTTPQFGVRVSRVITR